MEYLDMIRKNSPMPIEIALTLEELVNRIRSEAFSPIARACFKGFVIKSPFGRIGDSLSTGGSNTLNNLSVKIWTYISIKIQDEGYQNRNDFEHLNLKDKTIEQLISDLNEWSG